MKRVGEMLKAARVAQKMTLRELGLRIEKSAMYISEIENNKKIPLSSDVLEKIADELSLDRVEVRKAAFFSKAVQEQLDPEENEENETKLALAREIFDASEIDGDQYREILNILNHSRG